MHISMVCVHTWGRGEAGVEVDSILGAEVREIPCIAYTYVYTVLYHICSVYTHCIRLIVYDVYMYICVYMCVCMYIYLSIYRSIYLSIYLSIHRHR